jgi:integrase
MYIFYSTIPDKPMEQKFFTRELRKELTKLGLSKEDAKEYTFHSWRHFYTSYMIGKIEDKLLQSQTGHKTLAMLQFYGSHETDGDIKKIQDAQNTVFSDLFSFN